MQELAGDAAFTRILQLLREWRTGWGITDPRNETSDQVISKVNQIVEEAMVVLGTHNELKLGFLRFLPPWYYNLVSQ